MAHQLPLDDSALVDEEVKGKVRAVCADVAYQRHLLVNVAMVGDPAGSWSLIDAGLPGFARAIADGCESRFGQGSRPASILLTHAHFDHSGSLLELLKRWKVKVYAHPLEQPYLWGLAAYPPPDPYVGGGLMSAISTFLPREPSDVREWLQPLPEDGSVPGMPGWVWIHTPGHTPGHVSYWRASDRTLIVGDAFITTAQESAYNILTEKTEMHGPPKFQTLNWIEARKSVQLLASLEPETVITGHGRAVRGENMRRVLRTLAARFNEIAIPSGGVYANNPSTPESGSAYAARR